MSDKEDPPPSPDPPTSPEEDDNHSELSELLHSETNSRGSRKFPSKIVAPSPRRVQTNGKFTWCVSSPCRVLNDGYEPLFIYMPE